MRVSKEKKYISLKEAAEITGYSADYIGQLIRSGKLDGKQVFQHVVWVTTEDALEKYLKGTRKIENDGKMPTFQDFFTVERVAILYSGFVWFAITLFTIFVLFLGYVFAVSIDHKIEQKSLERLNAREI